MTAFGPYTITVNGSLQANGTDYQPIVFTSFNDANGWGGIRFLPSSNNNLLTNCLIENVRNTDPNIEGGAIYCSSPSVEIRTCRIKNCSTVSNGAGIFIANEANHSTLIAQTRIHNNVADQRGGGIAMQGAYHVTIENCLIYNNEAVAAAGSGGAGIHVVGPGNPVITVSYTHLTLPTICSV